MIGADKKNDAHDKTRMGAAIMQITEMVIQGRGPCSAPLDNARWANNYLNICLIGLNFEFKQTKITTLTLRVLALLCRGT